MPILDKEYFHYLPISERDKNWGLFVTGLGHSHVPRHCHYPRSVHPDCYQFGWEKGRVLPEFQVLYVVAGEGRFESKSGGQKKIIPGSLIVLFPDEWHRYRPLWDVGWEEFWLSFGGRQMEELVANNFFRPADPVLDVGMDDSILRPYFTAYEHWQAESIGFQQMMAANVFEILSAAASVVRSRNTCPRAEAVVRQARLVFEQHVDKPVKIEQVAASFSMSEKHFRRIFKQQTGLSPYQYHLQVRTYRAKEMLRGTTLTVKEIAARLCFETPYHFSNSFKQRTGMSPSKWRDGGKP